MDNELSCDINNYHYHSNFVSCGRAKDNVSWLAFWLAGMPVKFWLANLFVKILIDARTHRFLKADRNKVSCCFWAKNMAWCNLHVYYKFVIQGWRKTKQFCNEFANPDLQQVVESKTLMSCFLLRQQLMLGMKIAQEGAVVLWNRDDFHRIRVVCLKR